MRALFILVFLMACGSEKDEKPTAQPVVVVPERPAQPVVVMPPDAPLPTPEIGFPDICDKIPFPIPIPGCKTPSPSPLPDMGNVVEKEQFLRFHNLKRCWHNAPDIKWNDQLAAEAKTYASRCVFAHAGGNFGENLAMGYNSITASQDAWYMEYLRYNFSSGSFSPATGHFTQMVWIGSTELGCARVQCAQGAFDICRYKAAGNVIGQFQQNVKPLKSDISKCSI